MKLHGRWCCCCLLLNLCFYSLRGRREKERAQLDQMEHALEALRKDLAAQV
jgi:hypothetical protein